MTRRAFIGAAAAVAAAPLLPRPSAPLPIPAGAHDWRGVTITIDQVTEGALEPERWIEGLRPLGPMTFTGAFIRDEDH